MDYKDIFITIHEILCIKVKLCVKVENKIHIILKLNEDQLTTQTDITQSCHEMCSKQKQER